MCLTAGWAGGSGSPGQTGSKTDQADWQAGQVPGPAQRGTLQAWPLPLLGPRDCWEEGTERVLLCVQFRRWAAFLGFWALTCRGAAAPPGHLLDSPSQCNLLSLCFHHHQALTVCTALVSSLRSVLLKHQVLLWLRENSSCPFCHSRFHFLFFFWNPITLQCFSSTSFLISLRSKVTERFPLPYLDESSQ